MLFRSSEWLIKLGPNGEEFPIFVRDLLGNKTEIGEQFSAVSTKRLQMYAEDMQEDSSVLLLTGMNTNKTALYKDFADLSVLQVVYQWFTKKFIASGPNIPVTSGSTYFVEQKLKDVSALLQSFDTDIVEIVHDLVNPSETSSFIQRQINLFENRANKILSQENPPKSLSLLVRDEQNFVSLSKDADSEELKIKKIYFRHSDGQAFSIDEESDGTIRIMDLAEILQIGRASCRERV